MHTCLIRRLAVPSFYSVIISHIGLDGIFIVSSCTGAILYHFSDLPRAFCVVHKVLLYSATARCVGIGGVLLL